MLKSTPNWDDWNAVEWVAGEGGIFAVVAQGILDGSIGEDAARLLLKELAR